MRPSSPSIPERDFTLEALRQGLRVDGRGLLDTRPVELSFGPELGWVECALGKTRCVYLPELSLYIEELMVYMLF